MRVLAVDIGEKRIGIALGDDRSGVAVPVDTVEAGEDPTRAVVAAVKERQAEELVVGLPLSLSGEIGPQAREILAVVEALRIHLSIPVKTWDERLTTVEAGRMSGSRKARRTGAGSTDARAAAIILQAYLDSQRDRGA